MILSVVMVILVPALMLWILGSSSAGLFADKGFAAIVFGETWKPLSGRFGLFPFIAGSTVVTLLAMALAFPVSLCVAIYLSEYASKRVTAILRPLVDLLAGLPSVLYGMWGLLFVVPFIRDAAAPFFGLASTGLSIISAAMVLGLMVLPVLVQICSEVFRSVPAAMREAAFSLGATKAEVVLRVVCKKSLAGILAANILAFGRAFGETIAVMMVLGFSVRVPDSLFGSGATLPSLLANAYGEMSSHPLYEKALMTAAMILLVVIILFNGLSRFVMTRLRRGME